MKFAVIEVGSTTTKGYIYDNNKINEIGLYSIEFKTNYKANNKIIDSDKQKLYDYIIKIKEETNNINVYGTSIFRQLSDEDKKLFKKEFKAETGYDFNIVSAEEENEYTVYGVINNINYKGSLAVMIGGGGSTELSIIKDGKVIENANSTFGAMDVTHAYPDLKDDKVTSSFEEMLVYTKDLVNLPDNKAEVLVLAGGNYILFYETLKYKMLPNTLYDDCNQLYMLNIERMDHYDQKFFYEESLDRVKNENPDLKNWWEGARGMRLCVKALVDILKVKYIVPTKITMVYGIIEKIKDELTNK